MDRDTILVLEEKLLLDIVEKLVGVNFLMISSQCFRKTCVI